MSKRPRPVELLYGGIEAADKVKWSITSRGFPFFLRWHQRIGRLNEIYSTTRLRQLSLPIITVLAPTRVCKRLSLEMAYAYNTFCVLHSVLLFCSLSYSLCWVHRTYMDYTNVGSSSMYSVCAKVLDSW
ncbi:hypothetical protein KQX54_009855 [Cotesia glomerata]|uniref:Uncharacterized protein n=1 Tax=Cotesia glomerata TaxID=32391 RepID=A0AAV7IB69_COTGL|nr:hypothetical protein KQX54_009855 [Cotesia glomerata]